MQIHICTVEGAFQTNLSAAAILNNTLTLATKTKVLEKSC